MKTNVLKFRVTERRLVKLIHSTSKFLKDSFGSKNEWLLVGQPHRTLIKKSIIENRLESLKKELECRIITVKELTTNTEESKVKVEAWVKDTVKELVKQHKDAGIDDQVDGDMVREYCDGELVYTIDQHAIIELYDGGDHDTSDLELGGCPNFDNIVHALSNHLLELEVHERVGQELGL